MCVWVGGGGGGGAGTDLGRELIFEFDKIEQRPVCSVYVYSCCRNLLWIHRLESQGPVTPAVVGSQHQSWRILYMGSSLSGNSWICPMVSPTFVWEGLWRSSHSDVLR